MIGRAKDENALSRKPSQVKNRARRARKRGDTEVLSRELELLAEVEPRNKDVRDWDLEELAMGMPRCKDGTFRGRPAQWITADSVQREIKRNLHKKTFGKLAQNAGLAVDLLKELLESQEVDDKGKPIVDARTKLDAAKFIIEHVIGKAALPLEVDATDRAREVFAAAIVLDNGATDSHLGEIIEGDVVDDDEFE